MSAEIIEFPIFINNPYLFQLTEEIWARRTLCNPRASRADIEWAEGILNEGKRK